VVVKASKIGKQLKYADRAGIRFALIAGSDERAGGTVTVKDLKMQDQVEVPIGRVAEHLVNRRER
jgi:histidyl-tRNA synthetase